MFEFYYKNNFYKAICWIAINENNENNEYLILSKNEENEIEFISSKKISCLPITKSYLKISSVNIDNYDLININDFEKSNIDIFDYQNVNFNKLNFVELLEIYRRLYINDSILSEKYKKRIYSDMKDLLNEYKTNGKFDFSDDIRDLIKLAFDIYHDESDDKEIKNMINDFLIYIKIKIYSKMNLYELYREQFKINNVIEGNEDINSIGFPDVSMEILLKRIRPVVNYFVEIKENLILHLLLNISTKIENINPYFLDYTDNKIIDNFKYSFGNEYKFDKSYFDKLGMNFDLNEEFTKIIKWEFEYVCERIRKKLLNGIIKELKEIEEFKLQYLNSMDKYGHIEFVNYFLNNIINYINI